MNAFFKLGKIPEGALLCTVDVVGLYPSIPHREGLEAIRGRWIGGKTRAWLLIP